jgi:hypothetical protein
MHIFLNFTTRKKKKKKNARRTHYWNPFFLFHSNEYPQVNLLIALCILISILPLPVSQIEIKEHFNNVTEKSGISYELKKTKDLVLLTVHYVRRWGGHSFKLCREDPLLERFMKGPGGLAKGQISMLFL